MFYTEEALERYPQDVELLQGKAERAFLLSQQLAGGLSDTVTPQGVFCVCAMLDKTDCLDKMDASGQLLGLEDIQDPSNLGTVLWTMKAMGLLRQSGSGNGSADRRSPGHGRGDPDPRLLRRLQP